VVLEIPHLFLLHKEIKEAILLFPAATDQQEEVEVQVLVEQMLLYQTQGKAEMVLPQLFLELLLFILVVAGAVVKTLTPLV
jgi:hypothetical protein